MSRLYWLVQLLQSDQLFHWSYSLTARRNSAERRTERQRFQGKMRACLRRWPERLGAFKSPVTWYVQCSFTLFYLARCLAYRYLGKPPVCHHLECLECGTSCLPFCPSTLTLVLTRGKLCRSYSYRLITLEKWSQLNLDTNCLRYNVSVAMSSTNYVQRVLAQIILYLIKALTDIIRRPKHFVISLWNMQQSYGR